MNGNDAPTLLPWQSIYAELSTAKGAANHRGETQTYWWCELRLARVQVQEGHHPMALTQQTVHQQPCKRRFARAFAACHCHS